MIAKNCDLNDLEPPILTKIPNLKEIPTHINKTAHRKKDTGVDVITENDTYRYFILTRDPKRYPEAKKAGRLFREQISRLDQEVIHDGEGDPFRGFFTLFWTAMGYYVVTSLAEAYRTHGEFFTTSFFSWVIHDGGVLFLADMMMLASTFGCVLIQRARIQKWFESVWVGKLIQWSWEVLFFTASVAWSRFRDWPLFQSAFFIMHSLVMTFKMHSYLSHNGDLAILKQCYDDMQRRKEILETRIVSGESYDKKEWLELCSELKRVGVCLHLNSPSRYPDNVTLMNFLDFLLVPSIVYQLEYPRRQSFRPWYLLRKTVGTFVTWSLMYITVEKYIFPVLQATDSVPPLVTFLRLIFPCMLLQLMTFYIIFECICNGFAEISCFADRNFYEDWWNSSTFEEYARKWNMPVHEFLFRHVFLEALHHLQITKDQAVFFTFFISACLHELVIGLVLRTCRFYFFLFQMLQIPLIQLFRTRHLRHRKIIGNFFFWFGMFVGPPVICTMYAYDSYCPFLLQFSTS